MRTTIEIDDDVLRELKEAALRSGESLKKVVNRYLRKGLDKGRIKKPLAEFKCRIYSLGGPQEKRINFDKALNLVDVIEDEEVKRKIELRK